MSICDVIWIQDHQQVQWDGETLDSSTQDPWVHCGQVPSKFASSLDPTFSGIVDFYSKMEQALGWLLLWKSLKSSTNVQAMLGKSVLRLLGDLDKMASNLCGL